jgi:hypothetical protein
MTYAYSLSDISASFKGNGGSFPIGGESSLADEGVKITQVNPANVMKSGTGKSFVHSRVVSSSATVTFEFLKNSAVHSQFATVYNLQLLTGLGWGENIITLDSKSSGDSWTFVGVAFQKRPDVSYTKEAENIIWTFDVGSCEGLLGSGLALFSTLSI